jgi:hypothetical protein
VIANFFFYALGSDPRQKSVMGLYRTLLYQILAASPDLTRDLFPVQWANALSQVRVQSDYEILDDDIKRAYELLSKQHDGTSADDDCFALFIDGLDEYQATRAVDRREMVRLLAELVTSNPGRFKICVSSRMENPFMDMFSENTRLYLHKLTETDMQEYVKGNLRYVGTEQERDQLASSITTKAEGVFLWVVLVVQRIRKQSDDGARFSRLLSEVESLPNELSDLFQRILVESMDRRLMRHTISLLHFLRDIKGAREMHLWLDLSDFYFLEDYEADQQFAERASFPNPESETANERECRASRQLRRICGGLVEANGASKLGFTHNELGFTHRSVWDFLKQSHIRIEMRDNSFHELEALSQLKLASIKQYWWDAEQQSVSGQSDGKNAEQWTLKRHSILTACLVECRRKQQLDAPPFDFLESLDSIPQLSVSTTVRRALTCGRTTFQISLAEWNPFLNHPHFTFYRVCHTSRVQHWYRGMDPDLLNASEGGKAGNEPINNQGCADTVVVPWRAVKESIEEVSEYSTAVVSPLLTEMCSGRLEYPLWKVGRIHNKPLEPEKLAMLFHVAMGASIGRQVWAEEDVPDLKTVAIAAIYFLRHLFEQRIVSPNLVTQLTYGGQYGFIRIAAGHQSLSLWQQSICWWATVAAASGEFQTESDAGSRGESSSNACGAQPIVDVLETFIRNGADPRLMLKITAREVDTDEDPEDIWLAYTLEMTPCDGTTALELDVVLNLRSWMAKLSYPYGPPYVLRSREIFQGVKAGPLPDSQLSLRDWIGRSRLPDKRRLLKLMDEQGDDVEQ